MAARTRLKRPLPRRSSSRRPACRRSGSHSSASAFEARQKEKAPVNDVRVSGLEIGGPYEQANGPSEESLRKVFTCGHLHGGHNADCARKIVSDFATARLPPPRHGTGDHSVHQSGRSGAAQGDSFEEGICLALQGMLVSPHFLYRIERDPPLRPPTRPHLDQPARTGLAPVLLSVEQHAGRRACAPARTSRRCGIPAF